VIDAQQAALAALQAGRHDEAERLYRELLAVFPHPGFMNNLGLVLVAQHRDAEAIPFFQRAVAARPDDTRARIALSNALIHCGRAGEALALCNELLLMAPFDRDARHNRAVALRALARNEEAAIAMEKLLAEDPDDADAELNLAFAELMLERYERAWHRYEARWRGAGAQSPLPECGVPLWQPGESLDGRAVLVQSEQGYGDVIQFLRFAGRLLATARRVELHVPQALLRLVEGSFAGADVKPQGSEPGRGLEMRLGLCSLPLALGITVPGSADAYLHADAQVVARWRERVPPGCMAVAWRGNRAARHDARRSLPIEALEPWLVATARRHLPVLALQRDPDDAERRFLAAFPHVAIPGDALADFGDTAACMMLAQHVAAVDTAVIHLAGALGRPATALLQFASDWRWGIDRPAGATYRSVRTLRQPVPGDWQPVVRALTESLP